MVALPPSMTSTWVMPDFHARCTWENMASNPRMITAISGSAAEKGSEISFTYQMEVSFYQPDAATAPTLWDLGLTMRWPVVNGGNPPGARKPLRYRTMVSRNVTDNDLGYQFTP